VSINNIMDTMTTTPRRTRRRHSPELKTKILAECAEPGASVAKIAMAHGINANIVHSWRKRDRKAVVATGNAVTGFMPVAVETLVAQDVGEDGHVSIELHRAGLLVKLTWPLSAADQLSAWTRELLR
jgi:transposase